MEGVSAAVPSAPGPQSQTGQDERNQRPKQSRRRPRREQHQPVDSASGDRPQVQSQESGRAPPRNRTPKSRQNGEERVHNQGEDGSNSTPNRPRGGRRHRAAKPHTGDGNQVQEWQESQQLVREGRHAGVPPEQLQSQLEAPSSSRQLARRRFAGNLTTAGSANPSASSPQTSHVKQARTAERAPEPEANDLTSHLTHLLKTPPYPDCPICYSAVHPMQPTWSCSSDGLDSDGMDCCWTTFHMKCIRAWASKSVKETKEAYLARNEDHPGEWRCPNCQCKRTFVPSTYTCFCGSTSDPRPPRFATPHSCASPCTRNRKGCAHPCPLQCHPGPCPPCAITLKISCHCGKETKAARCSHLRAQVNQHIAGPGDVRSCGSICAKALGCGDPKHTCVEICHEGECKECEIVYETKCWCEKESKQVKCGSEELRVGWGCEGTCAKVYRCGFHKCEEVCHPHLALDKEEVCPFDPEVLNSCPCGKITLEDGGGRSSCKDPVPTCGQPCAKELGCGHTCQALCHTGPCASCAIPIERRCRCSTTTTTIPCHTFTSSNSSSEFLCSTPCPSLRSCGRHQCTTRCCPASSLHQPASTSSRFKKKKSVPNGGWQEEIERMEREQLEREWHTCDMVCGKLLGCGTHSCEEPDHRGVCPPCLRSSFDELICNCTRTILLPPIPCGTKISCPYPCTRPPPPCGHSRLPHNCHEDDTACPACPYLTEKTCMCGKNVVKNVRCSTERVGCGVKCGKVLDCGFHHCDRPCHAGECETCTTVCGKDRRLCLPNHHPCELPCHAPYPCDESEPCRATVTLGCPCGRIQQPAPCHRSSSNSSNGTSTPLSASHSFTTLSREIKCTPECGIAARNARLADALGISKEVRERGGIGRDVDWTNELRAFGKANHKFVEVVEKAFADFVTGDRKTTVLPSMPESKRNFVQGLGEAYRISTQAVDKEPHRSISLTRRIDTRIPHPLLSSVVNAPLGKLADLRQGNSPSISRSMTPIRSSSSVPVTPSSASRAWRAVTGPSPSPTPVSNRTVPWSDSSLNARASAFTPSINSPMATRLQARVPSEVVPENWDMD